MPPNQLRRPDSLVLYWEDGQLICEDYLRRERFAVSPETVAMLDRFGRRRKPSQSAVGSARLLLRQGLLRDKESAAEKALKDWRWGASARHFFFGTKAAHVHLSRPKRRSYANRLVKHGKQPAIYKDYPGRRQFPLPKSFASSKANDVLASLHDVRRFQKRPISKESLAEILRLACGEHGKITEKPWGELLLKTHHSAGGRHPIEVYPVVVSVDGLKPGVYHYNVRKHGLELLKQGDFSGQVRRIANSQTWVKNAPVYLLMTAVFDRTSFKYRHDYFLRSVLMDAGHMSQSVYLAAKSLGLGACATHALRHDIAETFLGIDGIRESFLLLVMFGWSQERSRAELISPYRKNRKR